LTVCRITDVSVWKELLLAAGRFEKEGIESPDPIINAPKVIEATTTTSERVLILKETKIGQFLYDAREL